MKFKLEVVQWYYRNGANVAATARHFNIDRKRIRDWRDTEDYLMMHRRGKEGNKKRIKECLSPDLDYQLLEYMLDERAAGRPVSNGDLHEKGLEIARGLGLGDFKASDGFITGWKRRNSVHIRRGTNESQKIPEDHADNNRLYKSHPAKKAARGLHHG